MPCSPNSTRSSTRCTRPLAGAAFHYDLLFTWFLDMRIDQPAFDATVFSKNRQRLLEHEVADEFFEAVVRMAKLRCYVSSEHFSVDGTLLKAWASHKSFKPQDGPPTDPPAGPVARREAQERYAVEMLSRLPKMARRRTIRCGQGRRHQGVRRRCPPARPTTQPGLVQDDRRGLQPDPHHRTRHPTSRHLIADEHLFVSLIRLNAAATTARSRSRRR